MAGTLFKPFAANQLATHGVRSLRELAGRSDAELVALGLRVEDIKLIRRRSGKR